MPCRVQLVYFCQAPGWVLAKGAGSVRPRFQVQVHHSTRTATALSSAIRMTELNPTKLESVPEDLDEFKELEQDLRGDTTTEKGQPRQNELPV